MPWHESLMPLAPNYLSVERSVAECAYAGCSTIWIVCNDDVQPLIRYQVGEKIEDPVYANRHFESNRDEHRRMIRIYYVPIHPRDLGKRDCLSWGAIHGAGTALKVAGALSKWTRPDIFYVSWPYGYYSPDAIQAHRRTIYEKGVILNHDGQSIVDNKYLGMTLLPEHIEQLVGEVRDKSTGLWLDSFRTVKLSKDERYSYRNFSPSEVFDTLDFSAHEKIEISDYKSIDSWANYCSFLGKSNNVIKPSLLGYKEWNEISFDE